MLKKEIFEELPSACFGVVMAKGIDNNNAHPEIEQFLDERAACNIKCERTNTTSNDGYAFYRIYFFTINSAKTQWKRGEMVRQYRYIDFQDRKEISTRYLNGDRVADIADGLGVTTATVYRELKRGETGGLDRNLRKAYNPVLAQQRVQENFKRRGKSAVNS